MSAAVGIVGFIVGCFAGVVAMFGPILCGVVMWDTRQIRPLIFGTMIGMFLTALWVAAPSANPLFYAVVQVTLFLVAFGCCWGRAWLIAHYPTHKKADG